MNKLYLIHASINGSVNGFWNLHPTVPRSTFNNLFIYESHKDIPYIVDYNYKNCYRRLKKWEV